MAGDRIYFRVTPLSGRELGADQPTAALDLAEVEVKYRKGYTTACGDGVVTRDETCDDGDTVDSGDGCDADCRAY